MLNDIKKQELRVEKKFVLANSQLGEIHSVLNFHNAVFQKSFPDRIVTSVYFDTEDFLMANEHEDGCYTRQKLRVRWYDKKISSSSWEIKEKRGSINYKYKKEYNSDISPLSIESVDKAVPTEIYQKVYSQYKNSLVAKSLVSYRREYYTDFTNNIRVTVDRDLKWQSLIFDEWGQEWYPFSDEGIIVELKIPVSLVGEAKDLYEMPWVQTKHSKYIASLNF